MEIDHVEGCEGEGGVEWRSQCSDRFRIVRRPLACEICDKTLYQRVGGELEGRLREERVFLSVGSRLRWRVWELAHDHRFDYVDAICICAYKRSQEDPDDS